jgi:coenzyme Q-binding protein COQ10
MTCTARRNADCNCHYALLIKGYIDIRQDAMMHPEATASRDAGTRMKRYAVVRTLPWSCEQLFDLAADVASYPQFLPGWLDVRILEHAPQQIRVRQRLGIGPVNHTFTSSAELQRPRQVLIGTTDAPFHHLRIQWQFEENGQNGCRVSLGIELETGGSMFETALAKLFEVTMPDIIEHFEVRARQLYGQMQCTASQQ